MLAVGGDLSAHRLVLAYSQGIFPWYSDPPILWWCPAPRSVLLPQDFRVWRSLRKTLRRQPYRITFDTAFAEVIGNCSKVPRPGQDGTWINEAMQAAYIELHTKGIAHSVEAWDGDTLVGGLYGIALGAAFFGESMFAHKDDASKVAFVHLVRQLIAWDFHFVDCQMSTDHLVRFGAQDLDLDDFQTRLDIALDGTMRRGPWNFDADFDPLAANELTLARE